MEILICLIPSALLVGFLACLAWALNNRQKLRIFHEQDEGLKEHIRKLQEEQKRAAREEWFKEVAGVSYRNEIEVEVRFILSLVKFLGYHERDIDLRVPVDLRMGSQYIRGEADWVLWDRETDITNASALVVVEAKAPTQALDEAQAQARSYAFGLNAPTYAVTNGQDLQVFRRGILSDTCVVDCAVTDLDAPWPAIYEAMRAKSKSSKPKSRLSLQEHDKRGSEEHRLGGEKRDKLPQEHESAARGLRGGQEGR